jgi:hypothetical protein
MVLQSIERWLILTETLEDPHSRSAALEGLQAALESVRAGARQLRLTHGLPRHLQEVLRDILNQWPQPKELHERLRCNEALVDVVTGVGLQEWRRRWSSESFGAPTDNATNTPTSNNTHMDAAAEYDFARARKVSNDRRR